MNIEYIALCIAFWQVLATAISSCSVESFQNLLPSHATILSAVPVANGSTYGEGAVDIAYPTNPTNLPENCALIVNVTTSCTSSFRFGIFLPTQWNGRFLTVGNGGFAGGINWLDMGAGIRYGFAVVSTDTGHNSTSSDGTWALNDPETRKDFGYRAIHGTTKLGKVLTEAFYGQNISYSYYSGASTGGRQGLREAQFDAESFDGLLIGAPAVSTNVPKAGWPSIFGFSGSTSRCPRFRNSNTLTRPASGGPATYKRGPRNWEASICPSTRQTGFQLTNSL